MALSKEPKEVRDRRASQPHPTQSYTPEHRSTRHRPHSAHDRQDRRFGATCDSNPHGRPHTGGDANGASDTCPREAGQHHRCTVAPGTAPYHRRSPPETGRHGGSRYAAGTAAHGLGGASSPSRWYSVVGRGAGWPAVGGSQGRGPAALGVRATTPDGSPNKTHLHKLQGDCQNGAGHV
jgi:hypothetical protein